MTTGTAPVPDEVADVLLNPEGRELPQHVPVAISQYTSGRITVGTASLTLNMGDTDAGPLRALRGRCHVCVPGAL